MGVKAGYATTLLRVAEIEQSIRFYELLGFATVDTDRAKPLGWARMHCEGGALMFVRAEEPVDAIARTELLYMYTPDLITLREQLLSNGVEVPAIEYPEYMPSGEIRVEDPDRYIILVGHWGRSQQEAWEKRISVKA
jgi:hypothetical protein